MRIVTFLAVLLVVACASLAHAGESWVGLNLRVQPLYIETNGLTPSCFGAGAEASWFPIKRFFAEARYSKSVFTNRAESDYKELFLKDPSPKLKPFTYWEAGAMINLIVTGDRYSNDVTEVKQTGTRVETTVDPQTGVETKRTVPVYGNVKTGAKFYTNEYRMFGIRGGIFQLVSGTDADVAKSSDTIRDANKVIVTNLPDVFTNHKMDGFYVGVARTRVFYSEGLWNAVYFDALISNKIEFKDKDLSGYSNRKIGGRIGFEGARRHIGGRVEAGIRPGVEKNRFYALCQFSIGLML
jgi:hypothetical protein